MDMERSTDRDTMTLVTVIQFVALAICGPALLACLVLVIAELTIPKAWKQ